MLENNGEVKTIRIGESQVIDDTISKTINKIELQSPDSKGIKTTFSTLDATSLATCLKEPKLYIYRQTGRLIEFLSQQSMDQTRKTY